MLYLPLKVVQTGRRLPFWRLAALCLSAPGRLHVEVVLCFTSVASGAYWAALVAATCQPSIKAFSMETQYASRMAREPMAILPILAASCKRQRTMGLRCLIW